MTRDQRRTLDLAVRYLKTLSAVERAHALGDDDDVEGTLGGVDPIDLKQTIAGIEDILTCSAPIRVPPPSLGFINHAGDIWSRKV